MHIVTHRGKNEGKNVDRSKITLINYRLLLYFLCLSIFESDIVEGYIGLFWKKCTTTF